MHDDGYVTTVSQTRLLHRPVPKLLRTLKMHVQGYETKTYTICIVTNRTTKRTWTPLHHIKENMAIGAAHRRRCMVWGKMRLCLISLILCGQLPRSAVASPRPLPATPAPRRGEAADLAVASTKLN